MDILWMGTFVNSCIFIMLYCLNFLVLKYSLKKSVLIGILFALLVILLEGIRLLYLQDNLFIRLFMGVMQIIIILLMVLALAKKKNSYVVFVGFSAANFTLMGTVMSTIVKYVTDNDVYAILMGILLNITVLIWMVYSLREICMKMAQQTHSWYICFAPAFFYLSFYAIMFFPVDIRERPENILAMVLMLGAMVLTYLIVLNDTGEKIEKEEMRQQNLMLSTYIKGMSLQADAINEARKNVRIIRHDMRHNNALLLELLEQGKYEEAKKVLHNNSDKLTSDNLENYCENVVINSIICSMKNYAEREGVRMNISAVIPEEIFVDVMELAIMVANLMENGIHAVRDMEEPDRKVDLLIRFLEDNRMILEIKNPCRDILVFDRNTGFPVSKGGEGHGLGTRSVKNFVDKYRAEFDCYQEEGEFIVRMLFSVKGQKTKQTGENKEKIVLT